MPTPGCVGGCCAPAGCGRRQQEGIVTGWSSLPVTPALRIRLWPEGYSINTLLMRIPLATCQAHMHACWCCPRWQCWQLAVGCAVMRPVSSCLLFMLHALCGLSFEAPPYMIAAVYCSGSALLLSPLVVHFHSASHSKFDAPSLQVCVCGGVPPLRLCARHGFGLLAACCPVCTPAAGVRRRA